MSSRPSPLPNRVTPFCEVAAAPQRGTMMGNRGGRIHEGYAIRRTQGSRRWICCVLDFKDRRRQVMARGYTELFFLDEATALAAGHRPCFECRRADALAYAGYWAAARGESGAAGADEMDEAADRERRALGLVGRKRGSIPTAERALIPDPSALPPGAMAADGDAAYLFDGARLLRWSFDGYRPATPAGALRLLTPPSILAALRAGYRPGLHPSAASA